MPTSVLLAILAGAGLLALAPALVRRYDADERAAADREESQARVLKRGPRGTGPGSQPLNPPLEEGDPNGDSAPLEEDDDSAEETLTQSAPADDPPRRGWERSGARRGESVRWKANRSDSQGGGQEASVSSVRLRAWRRQRYRRVLYVLLVLNLVEILGVILIGPGFWIGFVLSAALLGCYVWFLRSQVARRHTRPARPSAKSDTKTGSGRRVYVPAQSEGAGQEPEPVESARGLVPGFGDPEDEFDDEDEDDDPQDTTPPPSRRRTGGIRGRSYESPASL